MEFLSKYFQKQGKLEEYYAGIKEEKEKIVKSVKNFKETDSTKSTETKVTFAQKPKRLKTKAGKLF